MKPGQTIQICQQDGGEHWIFAKALHVNRTDDGKAVDTVLVLVSHPGNAWDSQQKIVPAEECRTADDVADLLEVAKKARGNRPHEECAKTDGFLQKFKDMKRTDLVAHYEGQLEILNA